MTNEGENGELLIKIKLVQMREEHAIFFGETVESVGFVSEYSQCPEMIETWRLMTDGPYLEKIAGEMNIDKASPTNKADVYVNGKAYSLKSTYSANSALVNHTNRFGFERVCKIVGADITTLDQMIEEYWDLRLTKKLPEDVPNSNPLSPFRNHKKYFRPIIEYFLFDGTGSRDSKHPAQYIIEYADPMNPNKWIKLNKKEAFDAVWDKLVFSLRSKKGMPQNYTPDYKGKGADSIIKWVKFCDGSYKGALHIRLDN